MEKGIGTSSEAAEFRSVPEAEASPEADVEKEKEYRCSVITGRELSQRIMSRDEKGYLRRDPRFEEDGYGGRFKYFIPSELDNHLSGQNQGQSDEMFYVIVEDGDKIVGLSELEEAPGNERLLWMKFVAVDDDYRGRHLSTRMLEETMRFAAEHGYAVEASSYSNEGWERLKDNNAKYAQQYGIRLIDKGRRI